MSIILDPAAIAAAKLLLTELINSNMNQLAWYSLPDATIWLEKQLPVAWTAIELITWATAIEETAAALPNVATLWKQALQTEAYALRMRAQSLTRNHSYI